MGMLWVYIIINLQNTVTASFSIFTTNFIRWNVIQWLSDQYTFLHRLQQHSSRVTCKICFGYFITSQVVARWKLNGIWIVMENLSCGQMVGSLYQPFFYKQLESTGYNLSSVTSGQHLTPDCKVHGANMGSIVGRQDPGGPMLAPWTLLSGACWDI